LPEAGIGMLTAKQRQFLKGLAHPLSPIVRVGRGGFTAAVVKETRNSLEAHELIKVRIEVDDSAARKALVERLAAETDSHVAGSVGKVAILYRARDEKPKIKLPR
jgi:RNA-binding protein